VEGHASGPADDVSSARRLSLARAIAVREALVAGGLAATQVDVRALGRTEAALDIADILPPGTPRSGQVR
jgi:outer membrane protein OmpA-like peptidoglycan-associated protein